MRFIFDLITSPFGLPINVIYEYVVLLINGGIAYIIAYYAAGRLGNFPEDRKVLHWLIRTVIFVGLWALERFVIWLYRNPEKILLIICIVLGIAILVGIVFLIYRLVMSRKG